ncbi:hypothetical protein GW7_14806 [Heterocephalus glaber]|uniref:Uncharacterized protein n=1 Tax=Heterocephalus glaber TaxID=10181 RepID=G5ASR5_HETGA|nr:hypothetical protein GW7_14806 [Heterocephalus glaber]
MAGCPAARTLLRSRRRQRPDTRPTLQDSDGSFALPPTFRASERKPSASTAAVGRGKTRNFRYEDGGCGRD